MHPLNVEPCHLVAPNGHVTLALFDLQVADGIRICEMSYVQLPDGCMTVYNTRSPSGRREASLRKDVRQRVAALVADHLRAGV